AKAAIGPAERARDSAKTSFETKKAEADRAEQDLSRCKSQANGQAGACAAEEQRKTRADQDEKLADDEARNTESALQKAKSELSNAESDLQSKKSDASSKKFTFEQTPPKVEVDKHCLHTYAVDTVVVAGEVECLLSGEGLYDTQNVLNRSVVGRVTRTDQTFPAQGGVCAEVAKGDPLIVPSRAEAKKLALASAIASTQKELLAAYGRYQEGYLTNGRTRSADGRSDDAVDAFVRYLLTLAAEDGGAATSEALSKAAKLRNVDDTAVRIGVFEGAKP
ncbi:MAG: hypothetical protein HOW73_11750, partial [Polyangiaceae bacterium]|nr:hypothetical protein [Polyangiaceae bacterium]